MSAQQTYTDKGCTRWEGAIADLLDGTLSAREEARLRAHAGDCEACGTLLEESEQGRAWAQLLHDTPPVPPAALLGRILARTQPLPTPSVYGNVLPHPGFVESNQRAHRLMTVAMAFFSIALTCSVAGLRLNDFRPASVETAATRQFFDAKKQVLSFYDNLPLIRELQIGVDGLRRGRKSMNPEPSARVCRPSRSEQAVRV